MNTAVDNMKKENGPFLLNNHAFFFTFNIIHTLCFGYTLPLDNEDFIELHGTFLRNSGNLSFWEDLFPFLRHFPTKAYKTFAADTDTFHNYLRKHVEEYKKGSGATVAHSLVNNMFMAQKQLDKELESTTITEKVNNFLIYLSKTPRYTNTNRTIQLKI